MLFREGLVRLLHEDGHHVVAAVGDAPALVDAVRDHDPDLAVVDVRMPPDLTDDGARAAAQVRTERPGQPILLLSQHVETRHSVALVTTGAFGYLLKDRVLRVDEFTEAARRVAAGGSALDPEVVAALLSPLRGPSGGDGWGRLSERERQVLALAAEGRSNAAIARTLVVGERTVETHMRAVLLKLEIPDDGDDHRRVLAVLTYLRRQRP